MSVAPVRTNTQATAAVATPDSLLIRATRLVASGQRQLVLRVERGLLRTLSQLRSTGTIGLVGLGLLGLALVSVWTVVLPQRDGLAGLREELAAAQARTGNGPSALATPARQSADFMDKLPSRRDVPAILGVVLQQAEAANLSLENGSYEWRAGKDGGPGQYRIALPVHGSYPSIRQFVEATLVAAPAVALDSLHIARQDVGQSAVDADVSFVIFLRGS
ncbi:MAG: hypothetical protein ACRER4_02425 [Steroidobacteraceae bacterium]